MGALGSGCRQLQAVDFNRCASTTDVDVSALANGCVQLMSVSLKYCSGITDVSLLALTSTQCYVMD
jgi:hypothetical protein